ncbi:MAG: hypothetical protein AAF631_01465 [Pseudomonadota bacterium]
MAGIRAAVDLEGVCVIIPGQFVVVSVTFERVFAAAASDIVLARAAIDFAGARVATRQVTFAAAKNGVVAAGAGQTVVAVLAVGRDSTRLVRYGIYAAALERFLIAVGIGLIPEGGADQFYEQSDPDVSSKTVAGVFQDLDCALPHGCVAGGIFEHVATASASHVVVGITSYDHVGARTADDRAAPGQSDDHLTALVERERVVIAEKHMAEKLAPVAVVLPDDHNFPFFVGGQSDQPRRRFAAGGLADLD